MEGTIPVVSIGLGLYKGKKYVRQALESLLNQSFTDFEILVGDNGSSDGSREICLELASVDERIKYYRHDQNIGTQRNFNFLLSKASGKYFMFAADDDVWHIDFIKVLVNALEENPQAFSAMTTTRFIDEEGARIDSLNDRAVNYSSGSALERISKLINYFDDCMTYGLFRNDVKGLYFPIWKGINRNDPINCAYPFLCYLLAKGDFILVENEAFWYNRIKNEENHTHSRPYANSFVLYNYSFITRKLNLVFESLRLIRKAGGSWKTVLALSPRFISKWFFKPSRSEVSRSLKLLKARRIKIL